MIRIGKPRESRWLELGSGVSVLAKPITTAIYRASASNAQRLTNSLAEERGLISDAGGLVSNIPDHFDRAGMEGIRQQFLLQSLAIYAIDEWRGVGNENGTELADLTKENISAFIRDFPLLAVRFEEQYLLDIALQVEEGNVSAAAANGTSAVATDTVITAETTTQAA